MTDVVEDLKTVSLQAAAAARQLSQPAFISLLSDSQIAGFASRAGDGSLAGLPFAVKDNIDVEGVATTCANPSLLEPATSSATAVNLLVEAGAVPIGKTNLDQYATGLVGTRSPFGACHSIFSAAHISGGSSSGSGVAVAAGVVPFALGTDTAGSGRVPAAFNGLVGLKATKGLVSTHGLKPACRSLDCVTILAASVGMAREVFSVVGRFDPLDPYSRPAPKVVPRRIGPRPVIGVPDLDLDLDPVHEQAWQKAIAKAHSVGEVVTIDVRPFLEAAQLLYSGPWVAERSLAFGAALTHVDGEPASGIDPSVRQIVQAGASITAEQAFAGMDRLAELRRATEPAWQLMDALLLPTTPTHPTLAEVAAEPIAVNTRLGRFTNMTNLLDLAAVAVPAGMRTDGLPFGVQLLGPAFSDDFLLDLGAVWTGELGADELEDHTGILVAVAGAHLTGQPLNTHLTSRGARLVETTTLASGYRMYEVSGPLPRPGVTRLPVTDACYLNDNTALEVEVWDMPADQLGSFVASIAAPLAIGPVTLTSGQSVLGFVCSADGVDPSRDITAFGGWRGYLASRS